MLFAIYYFTWELINFIVFFIIHGPIGKAIETTINTHCSVVCSLEVEMHTNETFYPSQSNSPRVCANYRYTHTNHLITVINSTMFFIILHLIQYNTFFVSVDNVLGRAGSIILFVTFDFTCIWSTRCDVAEDIFLQT